ncbi:lysine-2,3-aminomutase-like protein [Oecophyllibacter saccharovorans]|uniref:Lysine-2,3-aminomutase-like protein n=1 Tax=Oecophyllibacter saccharovorans TaxID=2558360 RepID=A0A506UR74_9PROT|nr:lysine-2,3-aminomutase-like protein [Oecophyllibacter saccharovorans]TPW35851.1 lysine-2,3-aminomutase-like protein [Oecophyllibacter saccharovorans]
MSEHSGASPSSTLRTPEALIKHGLAEPETLSGLQALAEQFSIAIPPAFAALLKPRSPENSDSACNADPIGLQVLPDARELVTAPHERADPIGDDALSPVPGVVHRYEDRALLKPLLVCPLYCRFCFRREHVGPDGGLLDEAALERAFTWFETHPKVTEVILTGGDPLMLSPRRLKRIIRRLSGIPHIQTLRLHSRVPLAMPERLTEELLDALETEKAFWLVIHANHASELTPEVRQALRRVQARAIPVLSQSVLLKGVNDTVESLESLLRALVQARVKPYYLHHLDAAPGTAHFHVPVEQGRSLLRQLRGRVTGLAWPTYVLDIPGGAGKVPIGPDYLLAEEQTPQPPSGTCKATDGEQFRKRRVQATDGQEHSFT